MAGIHTGSITLTNANVPVALSTGTSTPLRVPCRQVFIQGNASFNIGAVNVTTSTGIQCSAVGAGAAVNAPHTPVLGTTGGPPLINLAELYAVSATPGAIINFLYIS